MSKDLKIVFFGTPDFALDSLAQLESKFRIECVVTNNDKKSGRGQKIKQSEVKKYAVKNNIKILQPENLEDKKFVSKLSKINADLFIVVAFRKLPYSVFSIPKLGTINLHASLLPNYRGAAPINWCLINNEIKTGVTTFFINENIDEGDILLQDEILIDDDDNYGSLYKKLSNIGADLLVKTVNGIIKRDIKVIKQDYNKNYKLAPKLNKVNTRIKWNNPIFKILSQIKGLSPKPGAWTIMKNGDKDIRMKIIAAEEKVIQFTNNYKAGKIIINNGELHVITRSGVINCTRIQLENKREMNATDLINGLKFYENSSVS